MSEHVSRLDQSVPSAVVERALTIALTRWEDPDGPRRLAAAMRYAVFPRGGRIRPRVCLGVAAACAADAPATAVAAAAAIEMLHCASLVHDDLPCFDDAATRRGKPSVHRAFGERLAVLTGDALIVLAFETLAHGCANHPERLAPLTLILAQGVGMPSGIAAGQAWECEPHVDLRAYQRAKTGALFAAATMAGAAGAGADPKPWRALGERLGEAYQVADDLRDATSSAEELGKPVGRDAALGRPSAVGELGIEGALDRLEGLVESAIESIPPCPGAAELREAMRLETMQLVPKELRRAA